MTEELLMIFTRNPELGKVKSRIAKQSCNETAFAIYKDLLKHTYKITKNIKVDKWLFYSDYLDNDDIWIQGKYVKKVQSNGNLGDKMYHAFKLAFDSGYTKVAIIGSDIEELTQEIIESAFNRLKTSNTIGPAADGGYYLLGLNALRKDVFEQKNWGTNSVFKDTLAHFKLGEMHILPTLNDIDTLDDIKPESPLNKHLKHNCYAAK